jgi:hypothetical protein
MNREDSAKPSAGPSHVTLRSHSHGVGRRHAAEHGIGRPCHRARSTASALPGVLTIIAALLVASAGWFEVSITDARSVGAYASRSIALHAAEAALDACERHLAERVSFVAETTPTPEVAPTPVVHRASVATQPDRASTSSAEPFMWRQPGALDGPSAWRPFASWPGAAVPPACLIERWPIASRPRWRAYVITARGTGATHATTAWLQLQLAFDATRRVARRWRRVAAPPS